MAAAIARVALAQSPLRPQQLGAGPLVVRLSPPHARPFATAAKAPLGGGAAALVPGVVAAGTVMLTGFELADVMGHALLESQGLVAKAGSSPISGVPVAILLGLALKNQPLLALPASLAPGLAFCTKKVLQAGIICVGAKLSVYDVASTGSAW